MLLAGGEKSGQGSQKTKELADGNVTMYLSVFYIVGSFQKYCGFWTYGEKIFSSLSKKRISSIIPNFAVNIAQLTLAVANHQVSRKKFLYSDQ